jgi:allantoinase
MKRTPDIWSAWGGLAGVQTMLPVLLTEAVYRRGLSLPGLVKLVCVAPARRLGVYPRKGTLQPGADADMVFVDLQREWLLEPSALRTRWPLNPFLGWTFRGAIVATLVRGSVVFREAGSAVPAGFGRRVCPT